jgi:hypothetical protein
MTARKRTGWLITLTVAVGGARRPDLVGIRLLTDHRAHQARCLVPVDTAKVTGTSNRVNGLSTPWQPPPLTVSSNRWALPGINVDAQAVCGPGDDTLGGLA